MKTTSSMPFNVPSFLYTGIWATATALMPAVPELIEPIDFHDPPPSRVRYTSSFVAVTSTFWSNGSTHKSFKSGTCFANDFVTPSYSFMVRNGSPLFASVNVCKSVETRIPFEEIKNHFEDSTPLSFGTSVRTIWVTFPSVHKGSAIPSGRIRYNPLSHATRKGSFAAVPASAVRSGNVSGSLYKGL